MSRNITQNTLHGRSVVDTLKTVILDLWFGFCLLDGEKESSFSHIGCYPTQSIEYQELSHIFDRVFLSSSDVIMDVGCGKGRLFNYLLQRGFEGKMIGVEIDEEVASFVAKRLKRYDNIEIITGNALDFISDRVDIYFMFNPFKDSMFQDFITQVEEKQKKAHIIYFNPQSVEFVMPRKFWNIKKRIFYSSARGENAKCYYLNYERTI